MKPRRLDASRRNESAKDKEPTRLEHIKDVDDAGHGRKDSPGKELEKRTLFASQTEEASESLRYPESEESRPEDRMTQGRTESSDSCAEPVTSDNTTEQSMAKGCIETVDDESTSDLEMRLGYLRLGLHDR